MIRLKVGNSCLQGQIVTLSEAGNVRPYRGEHDRLPFGVAATRLKRGRIVFYDSTTGQLRDPRQVDPQLLRVSMSYIVKK